MLEERLRRADAASGAILDGFPRTAVQATALDAFLAAHGTAVGAALLIDVPPEDLVVRLAGRQFAGPRGPRITCGFPRPPWPTPAISTARPWSSAPTTRQRPFEH